MTQPKTSCAYLALLRGINVGGKNKLPMKDLVSLFEHVGCLNVRTFIQSGNVIFNTPRSVVKGLPDLITRTIEENFGYRIPVVLRTAEELDDVMRGNPFIAAGVPEKLLHVYFLTSLPSASAIATLDTSRSLPDRFRACGREIYVELPNGMGRTKLTNAYFDSKLATTSTARNWKTVIQLQELMKG